MIHVILGDVMRVVDYVSGHLNTVFAFFCAMWVVFVIMLLDETEASILVHKYSTRVVRTKYGPLRGVIVHVHPPVEAFLGVPYATPPVGSLR